MASWRWLGIGAAIALTVATGVAPARAGDLCSCSQRWIPLLYDADPGVQQAAAEALEMWGPLACDAAPHLIDRAAGETLPVRLAAASALAEIGGSEARRAIDGVVAGLDPGDSPPDAGPDAASAGRDGGERMPELGHARAALRRAATAVEEPAAELERLETLLADADEQRRTRAVRALASLAIRFGQRAGSPSWVEEAAVTLLARALADPAPEVRAAVAAAITSLGTRAAAAVSDLRAAASRETAGELRFELEEASRTVAGQAGPELEFGCRIGLGSRYLAPRLGRPATLALSEALSDSCPGDRLIAARLLRRTTVEARVLALDALILALDDPDEAVLGEVVESLGSMKEAARPALPRLLRLFDGARASVQISILKSLPDIGPMRDVLPTLTAALAHPDGGVCSWAAAALADEETPLPDGMLGQLGRMLSDRRDSCRMFAAVLLTGVSQTNPRAREELRTAWGSHDPVARCLSGLALTADGPNPAVPQAELRAALVACRESLAPWIREAVDETLDELAEAEGAAGTADDADVR